MAKAPKKKADVPAISAAPALSTGLLAAPTTTGPGGGALSAITPISFSSAGYPGAESFLLGASMPKGQTFTSAQFKGDTLNTGDFLVGENTPIQITDQNGNVLFSGTGYSGAQDAAEFTKGLVDNKDITSFSVQGYDPYTGQWQGLGGSARPIDLTGEFASMVAPVVLAAALPGIGGALGAALTGSLGTAGTTALGAALGSAGAGIARGQGIGEILKNAALSGGLAYGGASLGGALDSALPPSGALGGSTSGAGTVARGAVGNIIDVVNKAGSALAGVGSTVGAVAPGVLQTSQPTSTTTNPNDTLIVTGQRGLTPLEQAFSNWLPTVAPTPTPSPTTSQGETGDVIEVVEERPAIDVGPPPNLETLLGPPAPIPGGLTDGNILPSEKPADTTSTMQDIQTWLNRAGLASTVLGVLGDAVGGTGGAGTGVTTPYTSVLGPAPSFGRGAFTPYIGNYETYGFGPEFSFFGQAPAQTTTGPMASLLNPALPVNNTLLA